MASIEVIGGERLQGEIEIQGCKNAVLPILAASVLNKGISKVVHCPRIQDVYHIINLLEGIGCKVQWEQDTLIINATNISSYELKEEYVTKVRASIILLGALLGRMGHARIAYPGGCSIGARPIDIHLDALKKMQVQIMDNKDYLYCHTEQMKGYKHILRFPSVGATENIILAAVMAEGESWIQNAAREPEIVALCEFLMGMGAKIKGAGSSLIQIQGVRQLHDMEYRVPDDRIVTGTYLAAVAGARGEVTFKTDCMNQLDEVIRVMRCMGNDIKVGEDYIHIRSPKRLKNIDFLRTEPYPGFPTDMQSQMLAVLTVADGSSRILERIFESRFQYVQELRKLGADIRIDEDTAHVSGKEKIFGADVNAYDLRGGAALVIAGLIAEGKTTIKKTEFIERGYEDICSDLRTLGANITLKADP